MSVVAGKLAIVSGAAQGLGRAFAECLADDGAKVLAFDTQTTFGNNIDQHENVTALQANVTKRQDVEMVAAKAAAMGGADILINNAGQWRKTPVTSSWEQALADWDTIMNANLKGPLMLGRALVPQMIAKGGGDIVNVSSDYVLPARSVETNPVDTDLYSASKWALNGFTDAWAKYLATHNIRVNGLCMGDTDTPMLRDQYPDGHYPAELAEVVLSSATIANQLLSLLADGRTGENIGAWTSEPVTLAAVKPAHQRITG